MASQIMASEAGSDLVPGYTAFRYMKTCFVFQLNRELRSVVHANQYGVPCKERRQSCVGWNKRTSVQVELDVRILLLLVAVVVRAAFYDLHVAQLDVCARCLRGDEAAERDYHGDGEGDGGEEAEDILQSHQCGVHRVGLGEFCCGARARGRDDVDELPNTYGVLSCGGPRQPYGASGGKGPSMSCTLKSMILVFKACKAVQHMMFFSSIPTS